MKARPIAATVTAVSMTLAGCAGRPPAPLPAPRAVPVAQSPAAGAVLEGALAILDRLDEYAEDEAYRQVSERLAEWRRVQPVEAAVRPGGTNGVERLVAGLPERLRAPAASRDAADELRHLRDCCWLAGVARQGRDRAAAGEPLAVATELFRWTVRSLAIVADPPAVPTASAPGSRWLMPGEILLAGRASASQRAWIFLELLRQAGIDGVMLATGVDGSLRPWLPAAIIDGEAYLFEPAYGMPVSGPGGNGIATARQAAAEASVLGALSLPDRPYPLQAADVGQLVPLVAADPSVLDGRGADMQAALDRLHGPRVTVDAAALLARACRAIPGSGEDRGGLWEFPFETVARRREDPARVRPALQSELAPLNIPTLPAVAARYAARSRRGAEEDGQGSAFDVEERAEAPRFLRPLFAGRVREFRGDVAGAREAYMASRPSAREIAEAVASAPPEARDGLTRTLERMREDAGYWLGIVSVATGEDRSAVDFLERVTLGEHPQGRWTDAARVNLAGPLVALGRIEEAARLLRTDESPQRFGSRLRADALRP